MVVRNKKNGYILDIFTFVCFENRQFTFLPSGNSYYT